MGRLTPSSFAAAVLLLAGCTVSSEQPSRSGEQPSTESAPASAPAGTSAIDATCEIPPGQAFTPGDEVEVVELGEVDRVTVRGAVYPHPDYEGNPWSQWGQGIVVADGRFFSAIGDHIGADGNSFIYEYDPTSHELRTVGDILSYVDHVPGTWGYGKVHSQMVPGPCGEIYFSTYWGSFRGLEFEGDYTGDLIFRLDPFARMMTPLGVPVEFHGQASLGADPVRGLIYGEAVDPIARDAGEERGPFFAYDVVAEETVFTGPDEPHVGYRSVLVDAEGVAHWSVGGAELQTYDPVSGETTTHGNRLPGDWLRAATSPGPDGSVYGVTREPDTFFVMGSDGGIDALDDALGYTASMALAPDGSEFFYMPGAHGDSAEWGAPLILVDTASGDQEVVVELNELVEQELGHMVGGTYNVAVSADGSTVYMGVNASPLGDDSGFGEVILLVIEMS